jgi:hypothetical protein
VWSKWGGIPVLPREKIPPRWNFGNNTLVLHFKVATRGKWQANKQYYTDAHEDV